MDIWDEIKALDPLDYPPEPSKRQLNMVVQDFEYLVSKVPTIKINFLFTVKGIKSLLVKTACLDVAIRQVFKAIAKNDKRIIIPGSFQVTVDAGETVEIPISVLLDVFSIHELVHYDFNIEFILQVNKNPYKYLKNRN